MNGRVSNVHLEREHRFSKHAVEELTLVAGMGVVGDAHFGATVRHRSRVDADPSQPNLRQVHLMHNELFEELSRAGFEVQPGDLGENITTEGVDLLGLPVGTVLRFERGPLVAITGLRNPCLQIERFRAGLLNEVLGRKDDGAVLRRAGVMGVVLLGGVVRRDDGLHVALPPRPHVALDRV